MNVMHGILRNSSIIEALRYAVSLRAGDSSYDGIDGILWTRILPSSPPSSHWNVSSHRDSGMPLYSLVFQSPDLKRYALGFKQDRYLQRQSASRTPNWALFTQQDTRHSSLRPITSLKNLAFAKEVLSTRFVQKTDMLC